MNILLISQCKKNALQETRRIIDQFAERCGDRTWQTVITEAGLQTLHKLLRQKARKNTAIACYWTHGKNLTELLWMVGDRSQFNQQGRVPTNRTKRNILHSGQENHWQHGSTIQIVSTIAALLHDLGKSTQGFQAKLQHNSKQGDPYRHEWFSLLLFTQMINGCDNNDAVLERLANFSQYQQMYPQWYLIDNVEPKQLLAVPSLARWLGWLIVSHHRMPLLSDSKSVSHSGRAKENPFFIGQLTNDSFFNMLTAVKGWVRSRIDEPLDEKFWQFSRIIATDQTWLKKLSRYANKGLNHLPLKQFANNKSIDNPLLLHLSRLALMVGDHNYSSLKEVNKSIKAKDLIANTTKQGQAKQLLSQHLLGVADSTARFARLLPQLKQHLPSIQQHKAFTKRTTIKRFQWQDRAFDVTKHYQEQSQMGGFFGVNMASTGCGKTLANGRIMYALADPKLGCRFTIALGLRVLTLQTGKALRERLHLNDEQLAILVGGRTSQQLFELDQEPAEHNYLGSESADELVDGFVDSMPTSLFDEVLGTVIDNSKARNLLYTPLVTCTVDHLILASESLRGGKYIAPTLRLLTSDLILDEPDDFDQNDLPALSRLVYLVGLLGNNVLLSSATLTPDLIGGLFSAYQAGRKVWQMQNQPMAAPIICAWYDEYQQIAQPIFELNQFKQSHQGFVQARAVKLAQSLVRRQGTILPRLDYTVDPKQRERYADPLNYSVLAQQLLQQAYQLHLQHHEQDPHSLQSISVGLIRIANTKHIIKLINHCYQQQNLPTDTEFHLVAYHARQLLILRNSLEQKLDDILDRNDNRTLHENPLIQAAIRDSQAKQHIFIVIGSPVTEVGRDHDYDWAIIEPSSMRSIIQLVGRVWRHRPDKQATQPNVAILCSNLRAIANVGAKEMGGARFYHPGFESARDLLISHDSSELISSEQLANINAIPRIVAHYNQTNSQTSKANTLAELEHRVMANLFGFNTQSTTAIKLNYITSYWQPELAHHYCSHLAMISPFRQSQKQYDYVCQLDPDSINSYSFSIAEQAWLNPYELCPNSLNHTIIYEPWHTTLNHPQIKPWLTACLATELTLLQQHFSAQNVHKLAVQFSTVSLRERAIWYFHPWLGFYEQSVKIDK